MHEGSGTQTNADIVVVGAGVLGVSVAFWLSSLYSCRITVLDGAHQVAAHMSSRNTGVIHRPFYLDPRGKGEFAISSQLSFFLWRNLAQKLRLHWEQVGTLDVALEDNQLGTLARYEAWGVENGMRKEEFDVLDSAQVTALEPEVRCSGAFHSKTDVSVDFGELTRGLRSLCSENGVRFLLGTTVSSLRKGSGGLTIECSAAGRRFSMGCSLLINAAGGGAAKLAHALGLASEYSALNFRGEYWIVDEPFASRVQRNVYTPPKYPQYPFLDPHFVVRTDGSRQIGPNAVLVAGPYAYSGLGLRSVSRLVEPPLAPKLSVLAGVGFLRMVAGEWRSSVSKRAMCGRVQKFIPNLRPDMLNRRGISGIRSSLVGKGGFVPEALLIHDGNSAHVLNFNSPGATGAPAYSALFVSRLQKWGLLDGFIAQETETRVQGWDYEAIKEEF